MVAVSYAELLFTITCARVSKSEKRSRARAVHNFITSRFSSNVLTISCIAEHSNKLDLRVDQQRRVKEIDRWTVRRG